MHFVKIAGRAINLDNVTHVEEQRWHDCLTVKLHFVGQSIVFAFTCGNKID